MKKYTLALMLICGSILDVFAQISDVSPTKPLATDTISVRYHIGHAKAGLKGNEIIYARIVNYLQDGSVKKFHQALYGNEEIRSGKFLLPKLAACTKIEFYTLNKDDQAASKTLMVYENNKPVKGAYLDALFGNNPDSVFSMEVTNHPTHYYAYAKYMNVLAMRSSTDVAKAQINALLHVLDRSLTGDKNKLKDVGFLAAKCVGNAKIGSLTAAKSTLFQLFDNYPAAVETAFAFSIYNYEYYKASSKQIEEDVRSKLKKIFLGYPNAAICKDSNVFEYLRNEKDIPTHVFEAVLMPLYLNGELSYYSLYNLPELYIDRHENLAAAKSLVMQAITQFQDGSIQHQYRLNRGHYQMYVPLLLYDLAKINSLQNDSQSAIINASAAIQILSGSNAEGNFVPLLLQLRSKSYLSIGNIDLAMADYEKLYRAGISGALDSLKQLFPVVNTEYTSFSDYVLSLKPSIKEGSTLNRLANFSGTDLEGKKFSLSDLKGKVVVLNIWGIGCGPCIGEMPSLNQLVKEYAGSPEVAFIAITGDNRESLVKFFKTKKFDYKVINNVANISKIFNTNSLPVHMVIGKNGEIINRSIGAREDIKTFLKGLIEANL